jgi:hypothetical protein
LKEPTRRFQRRQGSGMTIQIGAGPAFGFFGGFGMNFDLLQPPTFNSNTENITNNSSQDINNNSSQEMRKMLQTVFLVMLFVFLLLLLLL